MSARSRILVAMIDGLDIRYLERGDMPGLSNLGDRGTSCTVSAMTPTVTNVNNTSIACAAFPDEHGITGNSYYDSRNGVAEYMENGSSILIPTLFERFATSGGRTALLTAKVKSKNLLAGGTALSIAAEHADQPVVERHGQPPPIYSAEINLWLWTVAIDLLERRPDLGMLYVHTTDFPMHAWRPDDSRSVDHLQRLDSLITEAVEVAPDIALYATADHGMNDKNTVWDLAAACVARGTPVRFALSAERDRYVRHHRTFGGTAWVWLTDPAHRDAVISIIAGLTGVEQVLTRNEAAARFRLPPDRIGDLMVLGDRRTVFGELNGPESETLADDYRSHGSLHEQRVPLIVYNTQAPEPVERRFNAELLSPLREAWR